MWKDNSVSISSLNEDELRAAIEKQNYLIKSFGAKLPDRGARLKLYTEKLKSELKRRSVTSPCLFTHSPSTNLDVQKIKPRDEALRLPTNSIRDHMTQSQIANADPDRIDNHSESYMTTLSEQLSSLAIANASDKHGSDIDPKSEEDLSSIPSISLNEVLQLRNLLNLPALVLSSFHWFAFTLRPIGDQVYLVVIDCENPDRQFVRIGLVSTWFPATNLKIATRPSTPKETGVSERCSRVSQSAEALRDLWHFISTSSSSTDDSVTDTPVPCLICHSTADQGNHNSVSDLIWFSRLLRSTRHFSVARAGMPRDCRFIDTCSLNLDCSSQLSSGAEDGSKSDLQSNTMATDKILNDLQTLRDSLFCIDGGQSSPSTTNKLTFRQYHSAHQFLNAAVMRSFPWMEASLELEFLRELKASNTLSERFQRSMRFMANPSASNGSTSKGLQRVPDRVLRRLASLGLGRTRLTRLAGLVGWRGFAGLLAYRFQRFIDPCAAPDENRATAVFVTDDLQTLQDLYAFFHNIHSRMHRHDLYYQEQKNRRDVISPRIPVIPSTPSVLNPAAKVHAWVASGNQLLDPNAQRQPRVLSMDESIELMKQAQKSYQEARVKRSLPLYPSLPPDSEKLYRYRDIHRDVECELDSSDEEESSETEEEKEADSDSRASDASLGLEDVD